MHIFFFHVPLSAVHHFRFLNWFPSFSRVCQFSSLLCPCQSARLRLSPSIGALLRLGAPSCFSLDPSSSLSYWDVSTQLSSGLGSAKASTSSTAPTRPSLCGRSGCTSWCGQAAAGTHLPPGSPSWPCNSARRRAKADPVQAALLAGAAAAMGVRHSCARRRARPRPATSPWWRASRLWQARPGPSPSWRPCQRVWRLRGQTAPRLA